MCKKCSDAIRNSIVPLFDTDNNIIQFDTTVITVILKNLRDIQLMCSDVDISKLHTTINKVSSYCSHSDEFGSWK